MTRPITGIDHVLIGVADLEAARDQFRRLGFVVTPRGRHEGWGTGNYCVMFGRDYLELLGMVDPAGFSNGLDRFLADGEGLLAIALGTDDAAAAAAELTRRGVPMGDVRALGRALELPEGTVTPRFALVHPQPGQLPGINGFLTQHLTPDLIRRPEWLVHPNAITGIQSLTIAVADPAATAARYEAALGPSAVVPTDDLWAVHLPAAGGSSGKDGHVLLFASEDDAQALYSDAAMPRGLPAILAMTLRSASLPQTRLALQAGGIDYTELPGPVLRIPASDACGAIIDVVHWSS